ncbi:MAG TPA: hypothetical protein VIV60_26270 [Polyangiaceae bacterium]
MRKRGLAVSLATAICLIAEGLSASETSPGKAGSSDNATGARRVAPDPTATDTEAQAVADHDSEANLDSAQPSGELLRLSQLPQAELMVKVTLSGNDPHADFEITAEKSGSTLLRCEGTCRFEIWPGSYRLKALGSSGYLGGASAFVVDRNADIHVTQSHVLRRVEGIVLTALGIAAMATGGTLLLQTPCSNECSSASDTRHRTAFVAFSAGAVLAPIGWMLVMQSLNPHVEVIPRD